MQKIHWLIPLMSFFLIAFCDKSYDPAVGTFECDCEKNPINLEFKYGVTAKNILSTYDCTFQKDLIWESPIKTHLKLTATELDSIDAIMQAIGFYDYPDTFVVAVPGDTVCEFSPSSKYYLSVEKNSYIKTLYWNNNIDLEDSSADQLKVLLYYIINVIRAKEEYKALPEATGGYD